eukprot:2049624-Heterocapsa_arctica.AAC.1
MELRAGRPSSFPARCPPHRARSCCLVRRCHAQNRPGRVRPVVPVGDLGHAGRGHWCLAWTGLTRPDDCANA